MKRLLCFALLLAGCATAPHPVAVPLDGGSVFVDDGGRNGIPIVFIHGNGGNSQQWRSQLQHFRSRGRRAVAIDLPGFGRSTVQADLSLDAMSTAIDRAVAAIGVDRFVIVGHSYGGAVVAKYAATHPQKIAGVVYLDAAATPLPLTKEQSDQLATAMRADKMRVVRGWFAPMLKASSEPVREEVFTSVENTPTDVFLSALLTLIDYDAKMLVNAYTGPRLVIAAADLETPAAFQLQFPEVHAVKIAGAGHWLMLDKPEEVNAALNEFVDDLR